MKYQGKIRISRYIKISNNISIYVFIQEIVHQYGHHSPLLTLLHNIAHSAQHRFM